MALQILTPPHVTVLASPPLGRSGDMAVFEVVIQFTMHMRIEEWCSLN